MYKSMASAGAREEMMMAESVQMMDASVEMEAPNKMAKSAAPPAPGAPANGVIGQASDDEGGTTPKKPTTDLSQVKVRTNLNETVFFYPHLMTDAEGSVVIKFTMNEALTEWKFLGLATTPDLQIGTTSKEIVAQKSLMVVPNPPRFFRGIRRNRVHRKGGEPEQRSIERRIQAGVEKCADGGRRVPIERHEPGNELAACSATLS